MPKRKRHGCRIGSRVDPLVVWLSMYMEGERLSTEIIGDEAGTAGAVLRQWINGRRSPNLMLFRAVLNVLGYDLTIKRITPPAANPGSLPET